MKFLILGPPRTAKNHQRIFRNRRTGKPFVTKGQAHADWEEYAVLQLTRQLSRQVTRDGLDYDAHGPVNACAAIWRDFDRGDALGYYQALADALERAGCVRNDVLIRSWDGSRLLVDKANPRIVVELTPLG